MFGREWIELTGAGHHHAGTVVGGLVERTGASRAFDDYPPVMDSADVAEMLGLPSIKTVQTLVREGRIPARRLPGGRRYRFLRDEIIEWLRSDATRVMPDAE